ncbi:methyltransferase domain-containing protein [candidate division KSB1 bacterium]|nr:methyltransferase domain-containing protein [candidate division KSB1 bacterium]
MSEAHRHFFNETASAWLKRQECPELYNYMLEFGVRAGDRVLDAGAGTGRLTRYLAPLVGETGQVVALDSAVTMLRVGPYGQWGKTVSAVCADLLGLPVQSGFFDKAVCLAVIPHCRSRLPVLKELYRALKPGGKILILHTCNSDHLNTLHGNLPAPICDDYLPPVTVLASELKSSGFMILRAEENPQLFWLEARRPDR